MIREKQCLVEALLKLKHRFPHLRCSNGQDSWFVAPLRDKYHERQWKRYQRSGGYCPVCYEFPGRQRK